VLDESPKQVTKRRIVALAEDLERHLERKEILDPRLLDHVLVGHIAVQRPARVLEVDVRHLRDAVDLFWLGPTQAKVLARFGLLLADRVECEALEIRGSLCQFDESALDDGVGYEVVVESTYPNYYTIWCSISRRDVNRRA
jgi:hypothetical protein